MPITGESLDRHTAIISCLRVLVSGPLGSSSTAVVGRSIRRTTATGTTTTTTTTTMTTIRGDAATTASTTTTWRAPSWTREAEPQRAASGASGTAPAPRTTPTSPTTARTDTAMAVMDVGAVSREGTAAGMSTVAAAAAAAAAAARWVVGAVVAARRVVGAGTGLTPAQATARRADRRNEEPVVGETSAGAAETDSNGLPALAPSPGRAIPCRRNHLSAVSPGRKTGPRLLRWALPPSHEPTARRKPTSGGTSGFARDTFLPVGPQSADKRLQLQRSRAARLALPHLTRLTSR